MSDAYLHPEAVRYKEALTQTAHDYATRRGIGTEFDDFMQAVGLDSRSTTYTPLVKVVATVPVEVREGSYADAGEAALEEVRRILSASISYALPAGTEYTVTLL